MEDRDVDSIGNILPSYYQPTGSIDRDATLSKAQNSSLCHSVARSSTHHYQFDFQKQSSQDNSGDEKFEGNLAIQPARHATFKGTSQMDEESRDRMVQPRNTSNIQRSSCMTDHQLRYEKEKSNGDQESLDKSCLDHIHVQLEQLNKREETLEQRYQKLKDFTKSQISGMAGTNRVEKDDQILAGRMIATQFDKDNYEVKSSSQNSKIPMSHFQNSKQPAWNSKKAWARPASSSIYSIESAKQENKAATSRAGNISASQNTMIEHFQYMIQAQHEARSELCNLGKAVSSVSKQQQLIEIINGASQSQTEAEQPDQGIEYEKSNKGGVVLPTVLPIKTTSDGQSQSYVSHNDNMVPLEDASSQFKRQESLQPMTIPDQLLNESTCSFQDKDDVICPQPADSSAKMKDVTDMLFRAMNQDKALIDENLNGKPANFDDTNGRNQKLQNGIDSDQTQILSKTTNIANTQSYSQIIEKSGRDCATMRSYLHQDESSSQLPKFTLSQKDELGAEKKVMEELDRIKQQKQLIISYLPKDYDYRKRDHQFIQMMDSTIRSNIDQIGAQHQRGLSSSSLSKSQNLEIKVSSNFGRNQKESFYVSKKSSYLDTQNTQFYLNSEFQFKNGETNCNPQQNQHQSLYQHIEKPLSETRSISNEYKGISGISGVQIQHKNALNYKIYQSIGSYADPQNLILLQKQRESSQDAYLLQQKRAQFEVTNGSTCYPTNATNITQEQIVISPDARSSQVYHMARSNANEGPSICHFSNEMSQAGLTWQQEQLKQGNFGTKQIETLSRERQRQDLALENNQHALILRQKVRQAQTSNIRSPPNMQNKNPFLDRDYSHLKTDLQSSGLTLLKKTGALVKNPHVVPYYKSANLSQFDNQTPNNPSPSTQHLQVPSSVAAISRISSFQKSQGPPNSVPQYQSQSSATYTRTTHNPEASILKRNSSSMENVLVRCEKIVERVSRLRDRQEDRCSRRHTVQGRSSKVGELETSARIHQIKSNSEVRNPTKINISFLKRLNRNQGQTCQATIGVEMMATRERLMNKQQRASHSSVDSSNIDFNQAKPFKNLSQNKQDGSKEVSQGKYSQDKRYTSHFRALMIENQSNNLNNKSGTSKINRYKKFEKELEDQRAQNPNKLQQDQTPKCVNQSNDTDLNESERFPSRQQILQKQRSQEQLSKQDQQLFQADQNNQLKYDISKEIDGQTDKIQKDQFDDAISKDEHLKGHIDSEIKKFHKGHRGSNFTLGNQTQTSGDPLSIELAENPANQVQRTVADEHYQQSLLYQQKNGANLIVLNSNDSMPKLNFNYCNGPYGPRALLNYQNRDSLEEDSFLRNSYVKIQDERGSRLSRERQNQFVIGIHLAAQESTSSLRQSLDCYGPIQRNSSKALRQPILIDQRQVSQVDISNKKKSRSHTPLYQSFDQNSSEDTHLPIQPFKPSYPEIRPIAFDKQFDKADLIPQRRSEERQVDGFQRNQQDYEVSKRPWWHQIQGRAEYGLINCEQFEVKYLTPNEQSLSSQTPVQDSEWMMKSSFGRRLMNEGKIATTIIPTSLDNQIQDNSFERCQSQSLNRDDQNRQQTRLESQSQEKLKDQTNKQVLVREPNFQQINKKSKQNHLSSQSPDQQANQKNTIVLRPSSTEWVPSNKFQIIRRPPNQPNPDTQQENFKTITLNNEAQNQKSLESDCVAMHEIQVKSEYVESSNLNPSSRDDQGQRKHWNDTKRSTVHEIQNASQYEYTTKEYVNSLEATQRQQPSQFVNDQDRTTTTIVISPDIELNSKCTPINQSVSVSKYKDTSNLNSKRSLPQPNMSEGHGQQPLKSKLQKSSEKPTEIRKLIKIQFEQAQMLMDLQKQLFQCQEAEKEANKFKMVESQSDFNEEIISSNNQQHSSTQSIEKPIQEAQDELIQEKGQLIDCMTSDVNQIKTEKLLINRQQDIDYDNFQVELPDGQCAYQSNNQSQQNVLNDPIDESSTQQNNMNQTSRPDVIKEHKLEDQNQKVIFKPDQSVVSMDNTCDQDKKQASDQLICYKHAPKDALSNALLPNSNRSFQSSKISQTHLSQISHQKASILQLIQLIYKQMEKIDGQISQKEKVDELRYKDMERKMRKLHKKYNEVSKENLIISQKSNYLASYQASLMNRDNQEDVYKKDIDWSIDERSSIHNKSPKKSKSKSQRSETNQINKSQRERKSQKSKNRKKYKQSTQNHKDSNIQSDFDQNTKSPPQIQQSKTYSQTDQTYKSTLYKENSISKENFEHDDKYIDHNIQNNNNNFKNINQSNQKFKYEHIVANETSNASISKRNLTNVEVFQASKNQSMEFKKNSNGENKMPTSDRLSLMLQEQLVRADFNQQYPSRCSKRGTEISPQSSFTPLLNQMIVQQYENKTKQNFGTQMPSLNDGSVEKIYKNCEIQSKANQPLDLTATKLMKSQEVGETTERSEVQKQSIGINCSIYQSQQSAQQNQYQQPFDKSVIEKDDELKHSKQEILQSLPKCYQDYEVGKSYQQFPNKLTSRTEQPKSSSKKSKQISKTECQSYCELKDQFQVVDVPQHQISASTDSCDPDKESELLLGSSICIANDILENQEKQSKNVSINQKQDIQTISKVRDTLEEVKAMKNSDNKNGNGDLYWQVQSMNGTIAQLRDDYQQQIEAMKQFYEQQINNLREEVHKREQKQQCLSHGAPEPSSTYRQTPQVALAKHHIKQTMQVDTVNAWKLQDNQPQSITASDQKVPHNAKHHNSVIISNKSPTPSVTNKTSDNKLMSASVPIFQASMMKESSIKQSKQKDNLNEEQQCLERMKGLAQVYSNLKIQQIQQNQGSSSERVFNIKSNDPQQALSTLLDMRKFYETIVQLNQAVSQKAQLEEKLIQIRVRVDMAKSMRDSKIEKSTKQIEDQVNTYSSNQPKHTDSSKCGISISNLESETANLRIQCRESEINSQNQSNKIPAPNIQTSKSNKASSNPNRENQTSSVNQDTICFNKQNSNFLPNVTVPKQILSNPGNNSETIFNESAAEPIPFSCRDDIDSQENRGCGLTEENFDRNSINQRIIGENKQAHWMIGVLEEQNIYNQLQNDKLDFEGSRTHQTTNNLIDSSVIPLIPESYQQTDRNNSISQHKHFPVGQSSLTPQYLKATVLNKQNPDQNARNVNNYLYNKQCQQTASGEGKTTSDYSPGYQIASQGQMHHEQFQLKPIYSNAGVGIQAVNGYHRVAAENNQIYRSFDSIRGSWPVYNQNLNQNNQKTFLK